MFLNISHGFKVTGATPGCCLLASDLWCMHSSNAKNASNHFSSRNGNMFIMDRLLMKLWNNFTFKSTECILWEKIDWLDICFMAHQKSKIFMPINSFHATRQTSSHLSRQAGLLWACILLQDPDGTVCQGTVSTSQSLLIDWLNGCFKAHQHRMLTGVDQWVYIACCDLLVASNYRQAYHGHDYQRCRKTLPTREKQPLSSTRFLTLVWKTLDSRYYILCFL